MFVNLLASFGEYEGEVISERTRDKMPAARRHGMWTGGAVPLGYSLLDKRLIPHEVEAEHVRWLYQTYLTLGSLARTIDAATKRGLLAKNGKPFTQNTVRHILGNPVYLGRQRAGDAVVPALHAAILDETLWNAVNAKLRSNHNDGGATTRNRYGALLRGLITCAAPAPARRGRRPRPGDGAYTKQSATSRSGPVVRSHAFEPRVLDPHA